jgi:transcriptional regulator with XRE-family HTH domain
MKNSIVTNEKYAANFKFLMTERKVTGAKLAKHLGIYPHQITALRKGRVPRPSRLLEIMNYFRVDDLNLILNGTPEQLVAARTAPARFAHIP